MDLFWKSRKRPYLLLGARWQGNAPWRKQHLALTSSLNQKRNHSNRKLTQLWLLRALLPSPVTSLPTPASAINSHTEASGRGRLNKRERRGLETRLDFRPRCCLASAKRQLSLRKGNYSLASWKETPRTSSSASGVMRSFFTRW